MNGTATLTITTPTDRDVVLTRVFDAPAGMVFDALTKPELLTRWCGPEGWSLVVVESDLRVGGAWRFVTSRPDGKRIGQSGVYREVVPGVRLVKTEVWDDWDAGETLVTTDLVAEGDKTIFTSTVRFPSREVRDQVLKSGLERGAAESYDKLADVLASMQPK
jgi:uncharacterized protein YndB with AHSA1/START domain